MNQGIVFAILGAIVFGLWTIFHQQASSYIDSVFGAIIVSVTAVLLGLIILLPRIKTTALVSNPKGLIFVILAGVCAFGIDYFALKAYGSGLSISVGGPIIIGGSIAIASIIGFFLGDSVTFLKIVALSLITLGAAILSKSGK